MDSRKTMSDDFGYEKRRPRGPSRVSSAGRIQNVYKLFQLRSPQGTLYNVAMTPETHVCDCPDSSFIGDGLDPRGCKHILTIKAVGMLDEVSLTV